MEEKPQSTRMNRNGEFVFRVTCKSRIHVGIRTYRMKGRVLCSVDMCDLNPDELMAFGTWLRQIGSIVRQKERSKAATWGPGGASRIYRSSRLHCHGCKTVQRVSRAGIFWAHPIPGTIVRCGGSGQRASRAAP